MDPHDLAITSDSHDDGIQSLGTTSLKLLNNRIVMANGATSAVILSTGSADAMRNVQIAGDLLSGGAFTVYGGYQAGTDSLSKVSKIAITGNQFTTAAFRIRRLRTAHLDRRPDRRVWQHLG